MKSREGGLQPLLMSIVRSVSDQAVCSEASSLCDCHTRAMVRQVVFGAKGSTAYILESALAANLRRARSEAGSDGSAQVTPHTPLTEAKTEIMKGGGSFLLAFRS